MIFARLRPTVFIPVGLLVLLLGAIFAILGLTQRVPEISSLEPTVVGSGDTVSIAGDNFGEDREGSFVSLAGRRLTASSYIRWTNSEVAVIVPEFAESGLVEVHTDRGVSDGMLLRHLDETPIVVSDRPLEPEVEAIEPEAPAVGDIITIRGHNFGAHRAGREITFTGIDGRVVFPEVESTAYEHWSPREIRVRVPSGADNGSVRLLYNESAREIGEITVRRVGGELSTGTARDYVIERNVRIRGISREPGDEARIHFWMPLPPNRVHQRPPDLLSHNVPEPLTVGDRMHVYEWNAAQRNAAGLRWNELYTRFAVSTDLSENAIRTNYDSDSGLYRRYVSQSEGLPVGSEELEPYAGPAFSSNPLTVVRNVWSWMRGNISFRQNATDDVIEVLESGSGSAAGITDTFVSMLRANGVPARPVRGLLAIQAGAIPFYSWAEFYIDGFGWVPADPARSMGAGVHYFNEETAPEVTLEPDIGEIDNRVIALRAGVPRTPSLHPDAGSVRISGEYAPHAVAYETLASEVESVEWRNPVLLGMRERQVTAAVE